MTEEISKIPSTLSVIVYSFAVSLFFPELFEISSQEFDEILYLMLPVILLPDILNISIKELRNHAKEIFYLAVVAVIASIAIATFITPYLLPQYSFTIGMLITLFTMLMATDAITVASIMSKFKLPERLKIYAESESLFNDVTALIIFYFIALPLIAGGEINLLNINYILLKVLILSTVIGFGVAYTGFLSIKVLKNPFDQFVVIYLVVIISFLLAEHFHIAGILSIVASALTFKYLVQKEITTKTQRRTKIGKVKDKDSVLELIKSVPAMTMREFREYKKEAMFIGIFANAIVFVIIANIIELQILFQYSKEILLVFGITTLIRFMSVSSLVLAMRLPFRWAKTLTLSGTKGALAIIMAHSIPESFIYKDMFEAIVIGNVLISTFFYTFILMFHIKFNKDEYAQDMQSDKQTSDDGILEYTKNVVDILEKDSYTQAYNRAFIEDIITSELARSNRYKLDLSLLILKLSNKQQENNTNTLEVVGDIIKQHIRANDYFGKISEDEYVIVTSNTSLGGALTLAQKISEQFASEEAVYSNIDYYFGATQANETDTIEAVLEKLHEALSHTMQSSTNTIEIEI
jgi:CPA1 family monovalent cation:H+ antiporter